ncbi:hypothetical protein, partial [Atlantibacter hermannii]|uniref:hypothetical protein n=1 Tax=Atlantibacter hermannii TaxID=565 RepID=UPI0034D48EDB
FRFAENTDDLFVGKTLLHGDVLMWLMKTLLTSGCINQRGAGHKTCQGFYHHFAIVLPSTNRRHKKTNRNGLVFLGNFGRHERI